MPRIHELIAAENDRVAQANAVVDEAKVTFDKKADHFMGQTRRVTMYDEARSLENTTDVKELVETVRNKLDHVWEFFGKGMDTVVTKDVSNLSPEARADVIVNDKVVLQNVPATALLTLERQLAKVKELYLMIPTLDPAYSWVSDDSAAMPGVMKTMHPQEGQKTEKVADVLVLYEATDKHPAQVKEITLDKNVAKITVERQSGMVSPATKSRWLANISALQTAVKEARQRANMAEVTPFNVADAIRAAIHT